MLQSRLTRLLSGQAGREKPKRPGVPQTWARERLHRQATQPEHEEKAPPRSAEPTRATSSATKRQQIIPPLEGVFLQPRGSQRQAENGKRRGAFCAPGGESLWPPGAPPPSQSGVPHAYSQSGALGDRAG